MPFRAQLKTRGCNDGYITLMVECPECGGRGAYEESCANCGGTGEELCDTCSADGWILPWIDGRLEMVTCPRCHGRRSFRCSECGASGEKTWTCVICEGRGKISAEHKATVEANQKRAWSEKQAQLAREAEEELARQKARQGALEQHRLLESSTVKVEHRRFRGKISFLPSEALIYGVLGGLTAYVLYKRFIEVDLRYGVTADKVIYLVDGGRLFLNKTGLWISVIAGFLIAYMIALRLKLRKR